MTDRAQATARLTVAEVVAAIQAHIDQKRRAVGLGSVTLSTTDAEARARGFDSWAAEVAAALDVQR